MFLTIGPGKQYFSKVQKLNMILRASETESLSKIIKPVKANIALVGGCFDILHFGHIKFLEKVKESNNFLTVLLESDLRVKKLKGNSRPIFSQEERAYALSSLKYVDLVVLLPDTMTDESYASVIKTIKPTIIGVTENDTNLDKKEKHAQKIGASIKVISHIETYSTSTLAKTIGIE
jgi:rfaE bifunctional protein nucleotidyltransferase chain/domain